jgi:hypothetical protein
MFAGGCQLDGVGDSESGHAEAMLADHGWADVSCGDAGGVTSSYSFMSRASHLDRVVPCTRLADKRACPSFKWTEIFFKRVQENGSRTS